jgi:phosphatidyl-myo-inositol dimannoside synthase
VRILVLTEHFLPLVGGSITWLVNTYSRYRPTDTVLIAGQHSGAETIDSSLPFRVERTAMTMADWDPTLLPSLARYLQISRYVYTNCRRYEIQQIHCAKVLPEGLIALFIKLVKRIPYLLYAHGEEIQTGLTSRKFRWLIPKIYGAASVIIANSRNTQALLQGIGVDLAKIHIIHPGVNFHFFHNGQQSAQMIRERHDLGDVAVVLSVGRLQRRKGHDMVIRALPLIKSKFPRVTYLIVGAGEELTPLQALVDKIGVTDSVIFVGYVTDEELPAYYAACDVFIMPNREIDGDIEGFGMVYLEANAAGKPVIGGKSGGTRDAILDGITGVLVDGNSIEQIASATISLLADPEKSETMGKNGRQRASQEFTWDGVIQRTHALVMAIQAEPTDATADKPAMHHSEE